MIQFGSVYHLSQLLLINNVQINVERIVGSGDAKDVICHTVEKIKADTLVMGSHGYGFLKRYNSLNNFPPSTPFNFYTNLFPGKIK